MIHLSMDGKYLSGCVGLRRLSWGELGRNFFFLTSIVLFHVLRWILGSGQFGAYALLVPNGVFLMLTPAFVAGCWGSSVWSSKDWETLTVGDRRVGGSGPV